MSDGGILSKFTIFQYIPEIIKAIRENKDSHNSKLESRVRELEAERDRLKEDVEIKDFEIADFRTEVSQQKQIVSDLLDDNKRLIDEKMELRARHTALVGEVERIIGRIEFTENYPSKKDRLESILDVAKRLKAALAEVKG